MQVSQELLQQIRETVLQKTVDGMKEEGTPYVGVLYAGLMLTKQGPKVLEFNCRFGDPECQVGSSDRHLSPDPLIRQMSVNISCASFRCCCRS